MTAPLRLPAGLRVCVLQPDYSASRVDYRHYDPPRDLTPWLPGCVVHHEALDKRTTYRQLRDRVAAGTDIFVNLCEGYLDWDVPGIDVIHALDQLGAAYTGPTALLYDPSKPLMKYVAHTAGVQTPAHVVVAAHTPPPAWERALATFDVSERHPLFVKPAHAGDSLGVDEGSLVTDRPSLHARVASLQATYGSVLVEAYVAGRECTVLVLGGIAGAAPVALTPVEYVFPAGTAFKTYALKTSALHPQANVPVRDAALRARLEDAALRVFQAFGAVGYGRCDFRLADDGTLYFLEINFTCSVGYPEGSEGSADWILEHDGLGRAGFFPHIIAEGLARHAARQRLWERRAQGVSGFGIFATRDIAPGTVVFAGEEQAMRLVTQRHVRRHWSADAQRTFRQYAWPVSDEVSVLWSENPNDWAPQNHSCDANTRYDGLDVVATRAIAVDDELTIDYGLLLGPDAEPFDCTCGAANCRGRVAGREGNSVTEWERRERNHVSGTT